MPGDDTGLDNIEKRVRIRITALGFSSIKEWQREHENRGGSRPYSWWRSLNMSSPFDYIIEAAGYLGTTVGVLSGQGPLGMGTDEALVRGGTTERTKLYEHEQGDTEA